VRAVARQIAALARSQAAGLIGAGLVCLKRGAFINFGQLLARRGGRIRAPDAAMVAGGPKRASRGVVND